MFAMCGIDCSKCEYKEKVNCEGCHAQKGNPFWGECPVAKCVISKNYKTCAECDDFPCELLISFAYDEKEGDNGKRIENLKTLR